MKFKIGVSLFIVFILTVMNVNGQQMNITDFNLNISDQTANNAETQVVDDNGNPCALLKIETTQKNFSFDGGTIGIAKVEENHKGEIWVYVPATLRRITIAHDQLGVLRDYYFPEELQPARVYIMRLIAGTVQTVVQQKTSSQFLVLTVEPKDAMVEIDGIMVETSNGTYSKPLEKGKHQYRISSKNYHTEVGVAEIKSEKVTVNVKLRPAYGWIEVNGPKGATVYIDGAKVGNAPLKSEPMASGNHDIRVLQDKYLPHREQVIVNDNMVTTMAPSLTANFVSLNLVTAPDAEIWVNEEMKGRGSVIIDLEPGEYTFESKKTNHRSQSIVRNITMASEGTIDIPAPVAITGTLMVNVMPVGANIKVDGKVVGETPMIFENILIGEHTLEISKQGYSNKQEQVVITENQTTNVDGQLSDGQDVRLSCGIKGVSWNIDGEDSGVGDEIMVNLLCEEHNVIIKSNGNIIHEERFKVVPGLENKFFEIKHNSDKTTIAIVQSNSEGNKSEEKSTSKKPESSKKHALVRPEVPHILHIVKDKETPYSISRKYEITIDELIRYNTFVKNGIMHPGDTLIIPINNLSAVNKNSPKATNRVSKHFSGKFTIENGVVVISDSTFEWCRKITEVVIPNSVKIIGNDAFGGCTSLNNVNMPNSVTSIGEWAFGFCKNLKTITLSDKTITIGKSAFSRCESLTTIVIPNSVTNIGIYAFSGCTGLKSVSLSNGLKRIEQGLFDKCSGLENVSIPEGVTFIGAYSFRECSNLKTVSLPSSIKIIREDAFLKCHKLRKIYVPVGSKDKIKKILPGFLRGK